MVEAKRRKYRPLVGKCRGNILVFNYKNMPLNRDFAKFIFLTETFSIYTSCGNQFLSLQNYPSLQCLCEACAPGATISHTNSCTEETHCAITQTQFYTSKI